jgi:fucose 4-O-acetylase-like acetyltransferase
MKPDRLNWIDYARGIAIMLVVYRHAFEGIKESGIDVSNYLGLEYANIFFFSFRMPLFFIVSGIFVARSLQKRGVKKFIASRARMILYPYFLWGFLQLSLQMIFTKFTNGHPTLESYLHLFYLPREIAQFWYLIALFNVAVLYACSKHYFKLTAIHNIFIGLVFFYFSAVIYQENIKTGLIFDFFHYYIFFAIGDLISRYMLNKQYHKYYESGKLLLALLAPFLAAQFYFLITNLDNNVSKYMFVEFYQPFIFLFIALLGCTFIINLSFYLQKKDLLKWLTVLGRHSLYIYVAHVIAFAGVRIILVNIFHIEHAVVLLVAGIVAGLLIPLYLYKLAERWDMRWIFTLEETSTQQDKSVGAPTPATKKNNL